MTVAQDLKRYVVTHKTRAWSERGHQPRDRGIRSFPESCLLTIQDLGR
jgi:hypothetical protein